MKAKVVKTMLDKGFGFLRVLSEQPGIQRGSQLFVHARDITRDGGAGLGVGDIVNAVAVPSKKGDGKMAAKTVQLVHMAPLHPKHARMYLSALMEPDEAGELPRLAARASAATASPSASLLVVTGCMAPFESILKSVVSDLRSAAPSSVEDAFATADTVMELVCTLHDECGRMGSTVEHDRLTQLVWLLDACEFIPSAVVIVAEADEAVNAHFIAVASQYSNRMDELFTALDAASVPVPTPVLHEAMGALSRRLRQLSKPLGQRMPRRVQAWSTLAPTPHKDELLGTPDEWEAAGLLPRASTEYASFAELLRVSYLLLRAEAFLPLAKAVHDIKTGGSGSFGGPRQQAFPGTVCVSVDLEGCNMFARLRIPMSSAAVGRRWHSLSVLMYVPLSRVVPRPHFLNAPTLTCAVGALCASSGLGPSSPCFPETGTQCG